MSNEAEELRSHLLSTIESLEMVANYHDLMVGKSAIEQAIFSSCRDIATVMELLKEFTDSTYCPDCDSVIPPENIKGFSSEACYETKQNEQDVTVYSCECGHSWSN